MLFSRKHVGKYTASLFQQFWVTRNTTLFVFDFNSSSKKSNANVP